jgi:hypothetical protein
MESVNYAIHVNYIEDMQRKLKTLIIEDSYASIVIMTNVINEKILTLA